MRAILATLVVCGACTSDYDYSMVQQQSTSFSPTLLGLGPTGYWRLDETSGTAAVNSSGVSGLDGIYAKTVIRGQPSGVNDSDASVKFDDVSATGYVEVSDNRLLSLTRAWDDFHGTSVTGWANTPDGDAWTAQVSGSQYFHESGSVAYIDPAGHSGTFQQGLNVTLKDGDQQVSVSWNQHASGGSLQVVSLVGRMVDTANFIRAELRENTDHTLTVSLARTSGGTTTTLASSQVIDPSTMAPYIYSLNAWWYLRFQYVTDPITNISTLRAKAFPRDPDPAHSGSPDRRNGFCTTPCKVSYETNDWLVEATYSGPIAGTISLRSANSLGTARPVVSFDSYWAQTPGLTYHLVWRPSKLEFAGVGSDHTTEVMAKGYTNGTNDHQMEYEMRFQGTPTTNPDYSNLFKAYIFNLAGGLGAGVDYPWPGHYDGDPLKQPPPNPLSISTSTWYDFVVEYDPGDYLDHTAGVRLYENGQIFMDTTGPRCPTPGGGGNNSYSGLGCPELIDPVKTNQTNPQWQIVPQGGTRPLHLGNGDLYPGSTMDGWLDEVAIFPRLLSPSEVASLYTASQ
jgi:hypothetical protein